MLRYVLLRHECPPTYRDGPHWDLMLERAGSLRTWSLLTLPAAWGGEGNAATVLADELPDHRIAYLDHQGEVSGGRGEVTRVAAGEFRWLTDEEGRVEVAATGALAGAWRLVRVAQQRWRLSTA